MFENIGKMSGVNLKDISCFNGFENPDFMSDIRRKRL